MYMYVRLFHRGVGGNNILFVRLVGSALNSVHTEASFSPNSTKSMYLQLAQVPRSLDLVIVSMTTMTTTTMTEPIALPLAHTHGVKKKKKKKKIQLYSTSLLPNNYYHCPYSSFISRWHSFPL